jgi:hypothetical protein
VVDEQREGFNKLCPGTVYRLDLEDLKLEHEVEGYIIKI